VTGRPAAGRQLAVEYVVPLRWDVVHQDEAAEFTRYVRALSAVVGVTVVDGSPDALFDLHATWWRPPIRHLAPEPWPGRNGKVAGVVTGVRAARHEAVIIADDDVRYTPEQIAAMLAVLPGADLVRPQNVFRPAPWHARWDTARSLLNRAFGADYPGTFLVRRSVFEAMGGYSGDVLFENLQLIRTVRAAGGREHRLPGLYVARRPPTASRFVEQRVRQAYDDFAQPARLAVEACWLPVAALAGRRWAVHLWAAGIAIAIAELGRRRSGGDRVYPPTAALWAPLWVLERSVCVWLAIGARLRGGVRYRGTRMKHATVPVEVRQPRPDRPDRTARKGAA
jgi:hypothetical protein